MTTPSTTTEGAAAGGVWELRLLGGMSATWGDQTITRFRMQKCASLLAFLALNGQRAHPREELADMLWPDADVEAARTNLRQVLAALRRHFEGPGLAPEGSVILSEGRAFVRLSPDAVQTDVSRFEALVGAATRAAEPHRALDLFEQAVSLYAGPLLPGFEEGWAQAGRDRLRDLFVSALEKAAALKAGRGDVRGALETARRAIAADPLREDGHALVLRLLAASGDAEGARRHLADTERLFREKLGMAPSAALHRALEGGAAAATAILSAPPAFVSAVPPAAEFALSAGNAAPAAAARPPQLPLTLGRFFGREAEIVRIVDALEAGGRLVTLTGTGGTGKTRLSIEAARRAAPAFPGGVHFAPLADLREPAHLMDALLLAVGLPRGTSPIPPMDRLAGEVAERGAPVLLVLDNAEHLVDAAADVAYEALARVPGLSLLVTSRQRLGVEGEREVPVEPLPVPTLSGSPEALLEFPSVQLFVHRAQAVRPDFPYNARNAPAVAELCALLEGIPLAIEIAASWSRMLTPQQMSERLGGGGAAGTAGRLDALASRRRDAPARHATLRAAIEWSYDLLPENARRFFAALSVFYGGWTLEAAEAVTDDPDAVLLLVELRERSFVVAEEERLPDGADVDADGGESGVQMRYRMLESLREFAAERLPDEEWEPLRARHAAFYGALAIRETARLPGPDRSTALRRLEAEMDNVRVALDFDAGPGGDRERLVEVCASLGSFWLDRGLLREGRARLTGALEIAEDMGAGPERRGLLHRLAGSLSMEVHDTEDALRHFEQARALCIEAGCEAGLALTLRMNGIALANRGDHAGALALYEQALALSRKADDTHAVARVLTSIGAVESQRGRRAEARPYFEEAITLFRQLGDPGHESSALHNLGLVLAHTGNKREGIARLEEAVAIRRELGELVRLANSLQTLGAVLAIDDQCVIARRLIEEALAIYQRAGTRSVTASPYVALGHVSVAEGRHAEAVGHLATALRIARETGRGDALAYVLEKVAYLASETGQASRAARLIGCADALLDSDGVTVSDMDRQDSERCMTRAVGALGRAGFDVSKREGRGLDAERGTALAQRTLTAATSVARAVAEARALEGVGPGTAQQ